MSEGWGQRSPKRTPGGEGDDGQVKQEPKTEHHEGAAAGQGPPPMGAQAPPPGGPPTAPPEHGAPPPWARAPPPPGAAPPPGHPGMPPHPGYPPEAYPPPGAGGMPPPQYAPPPDQAAAAAAGYPPMPPGYGQWPPPQQAYGPPPPMPGQPHMYPPPPPGYYPPYPPYPHSPHHPMPPPYAHPDSLPPPHYYDMPPGGHRAYGHPGEEQPEEGEEEEDEDGGEIGTYSRLKMYVKPKVPTRQEILDRRARKNAQSRARAARLRERISEIKVKPEEERTEEERGLYEQFEGRRQRKNDRSRERAIEKKTEIERILNKPERKRTKLEKQFLETALSAKQRKNEGDRIRRQRIKAMNKAQQAAARAAAGLKPVGGPPRPYGQGMPEIPMSPLHQGQYGAGVPQMGYPSPPSRQPQSQGEGPPGDQQGQSEEARVAGNLPMPFVPPSQQYDQGGGGGDGDPPSGDRGQYSTNVEERRNPDGSVSISIGRMGGENRSPDMMLYNDNGEPQEGEPANNGDAEQQE
uniref:Uncharacterized protein n=1 Tax=Grammatophora oceanica TaxID=210454 RepID=A0A7S1VAH2_9STRA|mmetsp:Transcript_41444/g.61333  ORF Transcript_41444/g.61333 Transcript_41444/m.61333 type:complete len:519 (+) Transcript_41444:501-2057(+)|eukprot:CAMPEP_0194067810 /NCGR_PEP_ID=MMETSP0009_2-20130614/86752_1 /TAXON_ID=210454 /ORGANISM="Grammatophora oceanica, Strain CCMP 410" /LENGTH=518 /DNA_ID=CAMNT_0038720851 /DNA_START=499 /DNA_END=2055 /DNA_ORIENTATION=+